MMRGIVRAATVLLVWALAALSFLLQEVGFALAAAAILGLVEIGLALRVRRGRRPAAQDPTRVAAARISCVEEDGALTVTLSAEGQGGARAPYVLVSRAMQRGDGPYLELSDGKSSVYGGIQDAYLTPHLLRLTLNERGAGALRASDICVTLPAPGEQRRLERALGKVLRGVPFTSDRSLAEPEPEPALAGD